MHHTHVCHMYRHHVYICTHMCIIWIYIPCVYIDTCVSYAYVCHTYMYHVYVCHMYRCTTYTCTMYICTICICAPHLLYPFIYGHLGCLHVLAIVKSAAVNTGVHVSFWIMFISRCMPRSRTARSRVAVFSFLRNLYTILHIAFPCVYLLATEYLYILFKSFSLPKISQFILLSYKHSLDSLNTSLFSDMCIANIVPRITAWLFILSPLKKRRISILINSNLSCILFYGPCL